MHVLLRVVENAKVTSSFKELMKGALFLNAHVYFEYLFIASEKVLYSAFKETLIVGPSVIELMLIRLDQKFKESMRFPSPVKNAQF